MKRFFSFLLFVLLLSITVAALQVWKVRREGGSLRSPLSSFFPGGGSGGNPERHRPEHYTLADGPRINVNDVDVLAALSRQRIILAKTVVPSVVSITTSKLVHNQPYLNDPLFRLFHRGTGRGEVAPQKALGSGVIVSKEGHIVTNNHVIEEMDEIEVKLNDGRRMQARLIGTDVDTDIAVLKVDASDLVPLPLGDSDVVQVGETVMAVGNPYGLAESVTQGIISAKGRHGSENVSDLFQTDAAINPGNSGGPLINVRGEIIGVNEAIFSESGGWQGVGFAIPSDTVRRVMDGILHTGRVIKSYLGVNLQDQLSPEVAAQQGLPSNQGALVNGVSAGSPAEAAHLQTGDFIRKFNGKTVNDFQELRQFVSEVEVDKTVPVELIRRGQPLTVNVRIGEKPPPAQLSQLAQQRGLQESPVLPFAPPQSSSNDGAGVTVGKNGALGGVEVSDLSGILGRHMRLPANLKGVIVSGVDADSPAAEKLQIGDVIEQVNQRPVTTQAEYAKLVNSLPEEGTVALSILRERQRSLVIIKGGSE